jgi:YYY domain-containing protein
MREALTWYVIVQVAAIAVWPLVARALPALEDRGWAVAKTAGVLCIAWVAWLVCMLSPVPFTQATLVVVLVLVGCASWTVAVRVPAAPLEHTFEWLRAKLDVLLSLEALFACAFVLFSVLRSHAPEIQGTEKPMDMAFLNGFISAQRLPTQDTWLAGFGVPYYYFGYFVLACVAKLTATPAAMAYNLAAATVPALTAVGLASVAWTLARAAGVHAAWATAGAALATAFALFCGNLSTFLDWLVSRGWLSPSVGTALGISHFADGVQPGIWPPTTGLWWFHASRIIPNIQPDGIDEFPFFSALLSDLHPHFVALPFELLVLALGVVHVLSRGATLRSLWTQGLAAIALGALLVLNTWDIAPFWLLYIGLSLMGALHCTWRWRWPAAVATPFVGAALYAPYFVGYSSPPLGLGIVPDEMRTYLSSMLVLFAWAIAALGALGLWMRWCIGDRRGWRVTAIGAVAGVALALVREPTLGLLVALVAALVPWPGVLDRFMPAAAATVAIGAFAAAMLLGVELVYLDDVFHSRMNTVFKFHENAWLLAGLAGGVGVALIGHFTRRVRWLALLAAGAFCACGLVYPASAVATRLSERPPYGVTLDGLQWLSVDDRTAVRWLGQQNGPSGRAVIAEGVPEGGGEYNPMAGGMATYSGAATVIGWLGHELQWRGPRPELSARMGDMARLYRDASPEEMRTILDRYAVQYVVVSDLERRAYGDQVDSRFLSILPVAFRSGSVTVFRAR